MGAKSMTILVNLNITSVRLSQKASMGLRLFFRRQGQSNGKDHAEDDYLKDLAFRDCFGDVLGKDVENGVRRRFCGCEARRAGHGMRIPVFIRPRQHERC